MAVIEIQGLTKDFPVGFWRKRWVRALDGLSLNVERGEVFGFLGPNGAGKTTTLKILMSLIRPTSGSARILGEPPGSLQMRRRIGYLPENPYFYDYLTAEELLAYMGRLFSIPSTDLKRKVGGLLKAVGLEDRAGLQLRKFSKGMIQRIGIAQALVNDPEVVFLDEPMSGLDPLGRREVRLVIASLKARGVTVFFSSHILPDVEALCDRVAIMNRGRLFKSGALHEILDLKIEGHEVILNGVGAALAEELAGMCRQFTTIGDRVCLRVAEPGRVAPLVSHALSRGAGLISVSPIRASLEDYFFLQVGANTGAPQGRAQG